MNEIPYINKWLTSTLKTDATLAAFHGGRVYADRVPPRAVFPLAIFNLLAGRDVQGNGTNRLITRPLYVVKFILDGGMTAAAAAALDQLDAILQNAANEVSDGMVISVRREQPLAYTEPGADAEQYFYHVGGMYRIDSHSI